MSPTAGRPRFFEKPVAWLLGLQLIGALKGALLYATYGKKLDPRDWMSANEISFDDETKSEFWFDYVSDVGDGTKAMYSTAYLAMCRNLGTKLDATVTTLPANSDECLVTTEPGPKFPYQLPRGEFLFVGGDTSYHTAAYMTLVNRFQHPFRYAYEDLAKHGLISNNDPRRPLLGIPGNHDYYDQIDGFRRQFRTPTRKEGPPPPDRSTPDNSQLSIPGFERVQEASYVALQLPFGWWFWGLDTEPNLIDRRQKAFFQGLKGLKGKFPPDKLILATCSPSTVCGQLAAPENYKVAKSMTELGVGTPFLPGAGAVGNASVDQSREASLQAEQCRLDLSGDVHHYARYWGPTTTGSSPRGDSTAPRPAADNYASVVSGAGAAFHHPTTTYDNEICEQVLYPSEKDSRDAIADRISRFWNVITGGSVWVAGLIISFLIFFGATVPPSSRQFIANIGVLQSLNQFGLKVVASEPITPTIIQWNSCATVEPFFLWSMLGAAPRTWDPPQPCSPSNPSYFFASSRPWPVDLVIGQVLIVLAFLAMVATLVISFTTNWIFPDKNPYELFSPKKEDQNPGGTGKKEKEPPTLEKKLSWIIGVITLLIGLGLFSIKPYRDHITPFISSVMVLFSFFTAAVAAILAIRFNGYLFKKSFFANSIKRRDWILTGVLWVLAILSAASGLWFFGRNNQPAYLVSDLLLLGALLGLAFCVVVLPFKAGGDLLYRESKGKRIVGKLLIALWHLLLQLFVPYLLIRTGNLVTWLLAAILLFVPIPLAKKVIKKNSGLGIAVLWIVYGLVMLTLPWLTLLAFHLFRVPYAPFFSNFAGWQALIPSLLAGGAGAVICCLWTGWYFAVCFVFNGHNNEVGGTARIEGFKQFVRFKLTSEGLTGYVIAVDDVSMINEPDDSGQPKDGKYLTPKLVDVFHLCPKARVDA